MENLNVFELTSQLLSENTKTEKKVQKSLKESVEPVAKKNEVNKIPVSKIRLESVRISEDIDDVDYEPNDEVVLIVDPEMEEEPATEEEAAAAAEALIGKEIHQCPTCGANYVAADEHTHSDEELPIDELDEDMDGLEDAAEEDCPVCHTEVEPIIVGEIAPVEPEVPAEENPVDDVPAEEPEMTPVDEPTDDTPVDGDDDFTDGTEEEEEEEEKNESYSINEKVLNKMLTRFARENYGNIKSVEITDAAKKDNKLTLEGIVTTVKGNKRDVKFVCENFVPTQGKILMKLHSEGPFTESAIKVRGRVPFVLECVVRGREVTPTMFKYAYKVQEGVDTYSVSGKVLAE